MAASLVGVSLVGVSQVVFLTQALGEGSMAECGHVWDPSPVCQLFRGLPNWPSVTCILHDVQGPQVPSCAGGSLRPPGHPSLSLWMHLAAQGCPGAS